jgi:hypothetical protein
VRKVATAETAELLAVDHEPAPSGLLLPDQQADEAGFTCSRCADEEEEIALGDLEADIPEGVRAVRIRLPDVLEADDWPVAVPGWNDHPLL